MLIAPVRETPVPFPLHPGERLVNEAERAHFDADRANDAQRSASTVEHDAEVAYSRQRLVVFLVGRQKACGGALLPSTNQESKLIGRLGVAPERFRHVGAFDAGRVDERTPKL
jgi:hypothetical protein